MWKSGLEFYDYKNSVQLNLLDISNEYVQWCVFFKCIKIITLLPLLLIS